MVAKNKKPKKTKESDDKEEPRCSKCHKKMEMVDASTSDDGRSLTVRHKCPTCNNMWSIRTMTSVSDRVRNPRLSDMYR